MAATSTPQIPDLLPKLKADFPNLKFEAGDRFAWDPTRATVRFIQSGSPAQLLHELGHATLHHQQFERDILLLAMERDAWQVALKLAQRYEVSISLDDIEQHLDTYRDWLHARSTCPDCETTGVQIDDQSYHCPVCLTQWRVNEARNCALRRYRYA